MDKDVNFSIHVENDSDTSKKLIKTEYDDGMPISEYITEWGFNEEGKWIIVKEVERSLQVPPSNPLEIKRVWL